MTDSDASTTPELERETLQNAYDQTAFEIHETGAGAEIPLSTPVVFEPESAIDPTGLKPILRTHGYACIAPEISETVFDSKLYDSETNEFFHVKIIPQQLSVFPKSNEFSFETFARFIRVIETEVAAVSPVLETDDE